MKISGAAGAFASACGTLAGFSVALIVLLLSPGIFNPSDRQTQELVITLFLVAGALYINAAGIFANATRFSEKQAIRPYNVALFLFLVANVIIVLGIISILQYFDLLISVKVGWVVFAITTFILVINVTAMISSHFSRIRTRKQIMAIKDSILSKQSIRMKETSDEEKK